MNQSKKKDGEIGKGKGRLKHCNKQQPSNLKLENMIK